MVESVTVRPWPDRVIDTLGHDPRSLYVESFWLPTLGPTALLLLRFLAHRFEAAELAPGQTLTLSVAETARALGLGPRNGNDSPLVRAFSRLEKFDLAHTKRDGSYAIRRTLPPIGRRHARYLSRDVAAVYKRHVQRQEPPRARLERRARRFAFTLTEQHEDVDVVERCLDTMGFPAPLCREAAAWASELHTAIQQAESSEALHPSNAAA